MINRANDANVTLATIRLGEHDFAFVESLSPERDETGEVQEFSAHGRHPSHGNIPLHAHGHGPFCKFRIGALGELSQVGGVYVLVVGDSIRYIGVCKDLYRQFNSGFGNISQAACYKRGGQVTNCKVNRGVLTETLAGRQVDLYFKPTPEALRTLMKKRLVVSFKPSWNGRTD